jgi:hypothetical protein
MKIPKHLKRPGMTDAQKKRTAAFVAERRKIMSKAPTYGTVEEATNEAVKLAKLDENSLPSVWKEPQDVGNNHAVVHTDYVEDAYNAGYTEEVNKQKIFDLANGRGTDEIEEVE